MDFFVYNFIKIIDFIIHIWYNNSGDDMNKNVNKNDLNDVIITSKKLLKLLYILIIVIGAYLILKVVKELGIINIIISILKILSPLFIGMVIAWLLNPFVKWLETKKVRRLLGVITSYVLLIGCILLLIYAIIPLIYSQSIDLVENFPSIFSSVKNWVNDFFGNFNSEMINLNNISSSLLGKLDELSSSLSMTLPTFVINLVSSVVSSIGTFIIGMVIGFYLLLSCNTLSNNLMDFIPRKFRKGIRKLTSNINQSLRNYVNGALIDACVVFVISTIVFAIIGLKAPLLFGLFCGIMNVIPYAGPYIGGAPAVIVGFSQGTGVGIAILIAIIVIQMVEGNVLQTLIISKTTKLNPVIIIIGLLIFGHFFGIIGMLLSTPIISVIKVIITYFDDKYDILNFE